MWHILYNLILGLTILPIGLMLAGSGGAGFWYILTQGQSKLHQAILIVSPVQTAAGIFLVYKSYDYLLSIFGIHLSSWL